MKIELNQTAYKTEAGFLKRAISDMIDPNTAIWAPKIENGNIIIFAVHGENYYEVKGFDNLKPAISNLIALSQAPESAFRNTLGKSFCVTRAAIDLEKEFAPKIERKQSFVDRISSASCSSFRG